MNKSTGAWRTKRVVVIAPPSPQILDVVAPLQVFARATELLQQRHPHAPLAYRLQIASMAGSRKIVTNSGIALCCDIVSGRIRGQVDTLLVAGGAGVEQVTDDDPIVRFLKRPRTTRRLGSICTGAFFLAKAGVLDGRRATTHWKYCALLAEQFPKVSVDCNPIFIRESNLCTSAGVTAGMDLALALVEEDFGGALALDVARELVLFLRRPGGQSQFSVSLTAQAAERKSLRDLQMWIVEHISENLSVEALATRVSMSPRHFARLFARETGVTPAAFVERLRVESARRQLEEGNRNIDKIAFECGFGSTDSLRRIFRRRLRVSPSSYRERFKSL